MRNVEDVVSRGVCVGCSACASVCGHIHMKKNEKGYYSPVIDEDCVHCGKCIKECIYDPDGNDE